MVASGGHVPLLPPLGPALLTDASAERGRLTGWKTQIHSAHDICAFIYYDLFLYCSAGL